jgi:hypothetical protein
MYPPKTRAVKSSGRIQWISCVKQGKAFQERECFTLTGGGEGFIENFADAGPVIEVFEVGDLEFGGGCWHVSIIR